LLEHKAICGTSKAEACINEKPSLDHVLQGLFYTWHLGIREGSVIYTSSDYRKVGFNPKLPEPGMKHSEKIDYRYLEAYPTNHPASKKGWTTKEISYEKWLDLKNSFGSLTDKKGRVVEKAQWSVRNIKPFQMWYDIRWSEMGATEKVTAQWKYSENEHWQDTGITIDDIHAQFITAARMKEENLLPDRPVARHMDLSPHEYEACTFCALKPVCDRAEKYKMTNVKHWEALVWLHFSESDDSCEGDE
jgi:hypothetical protein